MENFKMVETVVIGHGKYATTMTFYFPIVKKLEGYSNNK